MIKITKIFILFLIILITSITVLACNSSKANNHPLFVGEVESIVVLAGNKGDSKALGDLVIQNIGNTPITISNISLLNPRDISIISSFLVEIGDDNELVGGVAWPLQKDPTHWGNRVDAEGAVIEPGDVRNLVVAVTSHAKETASIDAVRIEYKDINGNKYIQDTFVRYFITSRDSREVMDEVLAED